jgi:preprotein translocase subunit SecD
VAFELNDEGALLMEAATRRLLGKPMGIFYDDHLVIAPVVRSVLRAQGVIGGLSAAEAKRLAVQLNSGALPVDVTVQP